MILSEARIKKLRADFPPGTRLKLTRALFDQFEKRLTAGEKGTVKYIDDAGNIGMEWDIGSCLSLLSDVDSFEKVEKENE